MSHITALHSREHACCHQSQCTGSCNFIHIVWYYIWIFLASLLDTSCMLCSVFHSLPFSLLFFFHPYFFSLFYSIPSFLKCVTVTLQYTFLKYTLASQKKQILSVNQIICVLDQVFLLAEPCMKKIRFTEAFLGPGIPWSLKEGITSRLRIFLWILNLKRSCFLKELS